MMRTEMIIRRIAASVLIFVSSYAVSQATSIPTSRLMNPEDLFKVLQSGKEKPLMLQVGSHNMFLQAHIPGSEYVGAASTDTGLQQLRTRVDSLPHSKFIILYCGCCPWSHCPNIKPADDAMHEMGFTNVKVLYISDNLGTNWVDKGYPTAKGE
jgi:thiosulfate/3-mercaptopyruvate sulfurtransferase